MIGAILPPCIFLVGLAVIVYVSCRADEKYAKAQADHWHTEYGRVRAERDAALAKLERLRDLLDGEDEDGE